jgi:hypothetical protein
MWEEIREDAHAISTAGEIQNGRSLPGQGSKPQQKSGMDL